MLVGSVVSNSMDLPARALGCCYSDRFVLLAVSNTRPTLHPSHRASACAGLALSSWVPLSTVDAMPLRDVRLDGGLRLGVRAATATLSAVDGEKVRERLGIQVPSPTRA